MAAVLQDVFNCGVDNLRECGDVDELPIYGILIQSPSFLEDPPGPWGAGIAERSESGRPARPGEPHQYINLILAAFL